MSDDQPVKIALWGPSKAGKTALLAYLMHSTAKTAWDVRPTTESWEFVKGMRKRLQDNQFPEPTAYEYSEKVVYTLERDKRRATLSVEDRAGKKWIELQPQEKAVLLEAQALVLLVDPNEPAVMLEQQIINMLDSLSLERARGVDDRPVAICVTKADALINTPEDLQEAIAEPERFVLDRLKDHIRPELKTFVSRRCPTHRFFPISAVGIRVQSGLIRPAVLLDEQLAMRVGSSGIPVNVTEPFDWIFGELEGRA